MIFFPSSEIPTGESRFSFHKSSGVIMFCANVEMVNPKPKRINKLRRFIFFNLDFKYRKTICLMEQYSVLVFANLIFRLILSLFAGCIQKKKRFKSVKNFGLPLVVT